MFQLSGFPLLAACHVCAVSPVFKFFLLNLRHSFHFVSANVKQHFRVIFVTIEKDYLRSFVHQKLSFYS